jgi:hypothetical protein
MKIRLNILLIAGLALLGCQDKHRTVQEETATEYMPVDDAVLGFWVMTPGGDCTEGTTCINDLSEYGNDLTLVGGDLATLGSTHVQLTADTIGNALRLLPPDGGTAALVTDSEAYLSDVVVGEAFALHVRARTSGESPEPVLSYGDAADGAVMTLWLDRQDLVLELSNQGVRRVISLEDSEDWREIYLASDSTSVVVEVGCEPVLSLSRVAGQPILSENGERLMVGASWDDPTSSYFGGEVNVVRLSQQDEADQFCTEGG